MMPCGLAEIYRHKCLSMCVTVTKLHQRKKKYFRREVNENRALLGYYTACSGNSLWTFRDNLSVPTSRVKKTLEDGTDMLSRKVGKELKVLAA
jgi:hypothetical protein